MIMLLAKLAVFGVSSVVLASNVHDERSLQSSSYQELEALQAVSYAQASYCRANVLRNWSCEVCRNGLSPVDASNSLSEVEIIRSDDEVTQALIGYDSTRNRIVVAFQGTINDAQREVDLQTESISVSEYCNACRVHRGFYSALTRVRSRLLNRIRSKANARSTRNIFFTGHSLGGAIATHAALQFHLENGNAFNILGYTFGQPRIGNQAFANFFDARVPNFFRVINYRDPVPTLIPLDEDTYWHTPQEIWYSNRPDVGNPLPSGSFTVLSNSNGEDRNGIRGECRWFRPCLNQRHHGTYFNMPAFADRDIIC